MIRRFARPYARAIMDVTKSPERSLALRDELAKFEAARAASADLAAMYANPGIEMDAKLKVTSAVAKKLGLTDLAVKVLEVLIRNYRINQLAVIVDGLSEMVRQETGTILAEVRSAQQPTAAELQQLQGTLERKFGRKVEVKVSVDPELIGGFVAKVGSAVYDASVAGKIHKFRESLG